VTEAVSKSGLTGWVLAIVRAMRASGIDPDKVLSDIGMDPSRLEGGYGRYSQEQISKLWREAVALSDSDFALRVAAEVRPSTFHVVGYAMSCSATLSRALNRFAFYCRLISDSATATLTESGEKVILAIVFDTGGEPPIYQTVETVLASVLAYLRWIAGTEITPISVSLAHPKPRQSAGLEHFFGCPVHYSQPEDSIVFARADLDRPILVADEELAALLDGVANRYLETRMAGRFAVRVRDALLSRMQDGMVRKSDIAKSLHMTERTLLRRLKDEGTTFSDVLDRVRLQLAFQYLQRSDLVIRDIAYMLGFSDEGTFSRAFKRWTGRRPSVIAQMKADEVVEVARTLDI
jgi:AraC-type DNA-binding domain-containing proteins